MKKIELIEAKGSHVRSTDDRKKVIVQAFRNATNCNKVTLLKEDKAAGVFRAHCLRYVGGSYESMGWFELTAAEAKMEVSRG